MKSVLCSLLVSISIAWAEKVTGIFLSLLLFLNASFTKLNFVLVVILSPCLLLATPRVGLQVEEDSPDFADLDISGDVGRTLSIRELPGSADYLLLVQETRPVIENFMFRFLSRFTVSRLSATGGVRWSRAFFRSAASTVQVQEEVFSGGEIGYLLSVQDPFGSGDRAELIKLDQNGMIDFSGSFPDLFPPLSVKKAPSGDLYLFGRYVNSESQGGIDLTVYQINSSNGAVKKNRSFDYEDSTDGRIIGATSSHLYFEIRSATDQSLELDRVDLVRTSLDLEQVSSRQYRADSFDDITRAQLGEDGRLLFSVFKKSDGSVQVLGLEDDLSPSVSECLELSENPALRLLFESRPSSLQNSALEVGGVSASVGGTMVVPVSGLAFSDLRLVVADCGAGGACLPFSIEKLPNGQLRLVVPTQSDLNYQVLRSSDLESSFQPFETLTGNGGTQVIPLSLSSEGTEFFKLTASPK